MTNHSERSWRIDESLKLISTSETPRKEVTFKIMAKWGVSRRIALEYIGVLIAKGWVRGGVTLWKVK